MNKQHEYRGYTFNIKVELNYRLERGLDGKREHLITLNDMGDTNYYKTQYAESNNLVETIKSLTLAAEAWVDVREDGDKSEDMILLESLGFK